MPMVRMRELVSEKGGSDRILDLGLHQLVSVRNRWHTQIWAIHVESINKRILYRGGGIGRLYYLHLHIAHTLVDYYVY